MREIVLPVSGKKVKIKNGKGRDLITAQKMAREPEEVIAALMSVLCVFDGQKKAYEDILELDLSDYMTLQNEVMSGVPLPTMLGRPLPSAVTPAGDIEK